MFAQALWMNIPLMVIVFALWVGVPLLLVLRRPDWHGKQETRNVPAYVTHHATPAGPIRGSLLLLHDHDR